MTTVTYAGDTRLYKKYKISGRYYVKCLQTEEVDGEIKICNFSNKREDRVKDNIRKGKLHVCHFIIQEKHENTILRYFNTTPTPSNDATTYDEEGIKNHLVFLLAKKKHFN